jgi:hypothetical protein
VAERITNVIEGHGDIASVLPPDRDDLLFFAAGVSNSQETRQSEYNREIDLLIEVPPDVHVVYFSSLSVYNGISKYIQHKRQMEARVKDWFNTYTIMRIGNIDWGTNPHTLINHLKANPDAEIQDVYRYVVDKEEFLYWVDLIPDQRK